MTEPLGAAFARAVAAKDEARVRDLLHPEVDFRGLTPGRGWEATGPDGVVETLRVWFDDGDVIEELLAVETDAFADRERAGYRLRVRNGDGAHLVEQQAYLSERDGRIGWLRVLCSGFRPV
ncbi:MAG TPA: hypothetical protein VNQ77_08010 [Frankiaceae bacterium]|nr:hypothetical protein [Frankiaceae bacterium]